jgi:vacuolar-type H+-ATPase subunit E/Vma4
MPLDRLAEEIRTRSARQLAEERSTFEAAKEKIAHDRDQRVEKVRAEIARTTDLEIAREKAQRIAAAKMQARKMEYEAHEAALTLSLDGVRQRLGEFTESDEYTQTLKRMYAMAVEKLGKDVRVMGRAQDASRLKTIAGKSFQPTATPILGGLIAETADGSRRLVLSFDELLRFNEAGVRDLLSD